MSSLPLGTRRTVALASLGVVVLISVSAHAQEERPVLFSLGVADSPMDRCGGKEALGRSVEQRLHRSVFVRDDEADIAIAIRTSR